MMGSMDLRLYQPTDLDATVDLWYRTWHHAFPDVVHPQSLEQWRTRFRDELAVQEEIWVVTEGETVVGFLALIPPTGYLHQIFVDPHSQGQGIGKLLLDHAKSRCPQGLTLHTAERNQAAREFYEAQGFVEGARGINPINGMADLEYRWQPEPTALH
jgi:putative acetyltransferase